MSAIVNAIRGMRFELNRIDLTLTAHVIMSIHVGIAGSSAAKMRVAPACLL